LCATSGTTGARQLVGFSAADWDRLADQLGRRGRTVGLDADDLVANTHGYGLWIGGPALDLVARGAGAGLLPIGPGHTDQLIAWLSTLPITAMSATSSFLRYLCERLDGALDRRDRAGWQLRFGLVGGEGASIALRREVAGRLGPSFRWQELYGSTEVGGPTLGWSPPDDPFGGALLLDTDEFVVELLHPDCDEAVAPGEVGEITVTTPYREVDPLIRYRTRDLTVLRDAEAGTVGALVGRVDDALKIRGALVYPGAIEAIVVEHTSPGSEWRIELDRRPGELDELTVVVEEDDRTRRDELVERIHAGTGIRPVVDLVDRGTLPRFDGKARRVTDRRL
jgi:phenylacetate-coenzyme A ligase PaaK-like adenylate-forming protein